MSTTATLNAIHRFISRRGTPMSFYSDNGTQLMAARTELQEVFKQISWCKIIHSLENRSPPITWRTSAPLAPHVGGVWEILVGSMKRSLYALMENRTTVSYDAFQTLLAQAEACVNSRPLSPRSDDDRDGAAITPSHLLLGRAILQLPDHAANYQNPQSYDLQYQQRRALHQEYWSRWLQEYLLGLQGTQKWHKLRPEPRVGELILVKDLRFPRRHWPLAVITKVTPSLADGKVRTVHFRYWVPETEQMVHDSRDIRYILRLEDHSEQSLDRIIPIQDKLALSRRDGVLRPPPQLVKAQRQAALEKERQKALLKKALRRNPFVAVSKGT